MPSRRRAFWIVLAVFVPLGLLAGCRPSRTALLAAGPDVGVSGRPGEGPGTLVDCGAGRSWLARLEPHDFDARLELRDAGGRELAAVGAPAMAAGRQYLYGEPAPRNGARLRIVAAGSAGAEARYRLDVFCLAPATSAEVTVALHAMSRAGDPARATDGARRDAAVARYLEAEETWTRLGESRLAADVALQLAALHYYERQEWQPALAAARRAARFAQANADPWLRAHARLLEGAAALELANAGQASGGPDGSPAGSAAAASDPWATAETAFNEAHELYRAGGAPLAAARAQNLLAGVHYARGDFDAAAAGFEAVVAALRLTGAAEEEDKAAGNLATVRYDRGDYVGAARAFERILERPPRAPTEMRAVTLQNYAAASAVIGESERALSAYRESFDIARRLGNDDLLARALAGLGVNHSRLGHRDLAATYLQDAVALRRRQGRAEPLAYALAQLGDVYQQQRDLVRAGAAHREAVEAIGPAAAPALRARMLQALGDAQASAGRHALAIGTYTDALQLLSTPKLGFAPRLLASRARSRRLIGELALARADAGQAVALARDNDDRETLIAALIEDSRLAIARNDPTAALRAAESAVSEVERLPTGAANPDNRLTLRARLRAAYDLRVQLLAQDAERARLRGDVAGSRRRALAALRATIGGGPAPLAAGPASPAPSLDFDPLEETYTRLVARRYRLETLAERNAEPSPTMRALEREVALLRTRLATGVTPAALSVTAAAPAGAAPRAALRVENASAASALPGVAPRGTTAISYWLGDEQSWAWTVTPEGVELHALPPRAVVDAAVGRLLAQVRSIGVDDAAVGSAAAVLERLVLPAPMTGAAARHWRVVPDGSLGSVPWALLASRRGIESASLLPSVSALPGAAGGATEPRRDRDRALRVALFGDPVFGGQDTRAPRPAAGAAAPRAAVATLGPESDPREYARLPGTAREVAAIAGLAGATVFVQATGLQATRAAFLQLPPDRVDVLHVATHATIDPEIPELAALVFSRLDAAGRSLPGNVRARDILDMRAAPALVVLSACDAAAEPAGIAEGRMNLVRAFLASGSRHVVASLWEASDAATVELMTRFYEGLLQQRLDPEAALVRAQRELAASERWRAPFYWAGFVITQAAP